MAHGATPVILERGDELRQLVDRMTNLGGIFGERQFPNELWGVISLNIRYLGESYYGMDTVYGWDNRTVLATIGRNDRCPGLDRSKATAHIGRSPRQPHSQMTKT